MDTATEVDTEAKKREDARLRLLNQYRLDGSKFYYKSQANQRGTPTVAFAEKNGGKTLATSTNDEKVAKSIVLAAESKGWDSIKLSGSNAFKRAVWLEARLHGIAVRGFTPQEQDLHDLAQMQKQTSRQTHDHKLNQHESPDRRGENKEAAALIKAVAESVLADAKISQTLQKSILEKIGQRLANGKTPVIPVYDKTAPISASRQEQARPVVERNAQRDKSR
jgi:hypothetical protein